MDFEIRELMAEDVTPNLSRCVTEWRNNSLKFFFDQTPVTEDSSKKFLESKTQDPGSIFAVAFNNGEPIGHVGIIAGLPGFEPELDNLIVGGRAKGHYVAQELEKWAIEYSQTKLGAESIGLRLLAHNFLAKRLHIENGFAKVEDLQLHEFSKGFNKVFSVCTKNECTLPHSHEKAEYWQRLLG